jgi:hypothetical protein
MKSMGKSMGKWEIYREIYREMHWKNGKAMGNLCIGKSMGKMGNL